MSEQPQLDPSLLEAVVRTTPDAVVSIDADGTLTGWNPAAATLFGWPAEEVLGQPLTEVLVPPELRSAHRNGLSRYVETRTSRVSGRPLALTALRRDGSRLPVQLTIWPSETDEDIRFHAFLRESVESSVQRARLEHSRAQYLRLATAAPGASFTHRVGPDGVGRTAFVAGGTDLLLGLAASRTANLEDLVHADDRAGFGVALDVSRGDLTMLTWEGRLVLPGGPERTVLVTATPVATTDGGTQWDGLVLDVTAEDLAHRTIVDQARRGDLLMLALDALAAEVAPALVVCDEAGFVVAASPAGRSALGEGIDLVPSATLATAEPLRDLAGDVLGYLLRDLDPR
ncbi:MAG TPA: PAS domain S-box protein [Nocardioides sp.]|nr:PAS domain S-box protein [Nocardioides sp.]